MQSEWPTEKKKNEKTKKKQINEISLGRGVRLLTPVIQDLVSTLRLRREAQTVAIAKDQTF